MKNKINVNAFYTRSINLERDSASKAALEAYIPTSRALITLNRISETLNEKPSLRSWALIGPYGAGKSCFSNFLSHLFGNSSDEKTTIAQRLLRHHDKELSQKFAKNIKNTNGYCRVLLTGSPDRLSMRFMQSLQEAAEMYFKMKRGRLPSIVNELKSAASSDELPVSEIIHLVKKLQSAVYKAGGIGILVVIDELGKFLEYAARHQGSDEIYILQALAEHAYSAQKAPLYLVVLLHQSFEQYAKGLTDSLKNEWSKVHGRYEDIPFLETTEQVIRIISAAIEHNFKKDEKEVIKKLTKKVVTALEKHKALPSTLDKKTAIELLSQCYPIHPVTLLLLPKLCQKIAQNERTLFSYLGSHEIHGFKHGLNQLRKIGDWIYPCEVYDYFILNQPAAIMDHFSHRRWVEVVTALERIGDAPHNEISLLKSIGLLNIVGAQGDFKAAKDIVEQCLPLKKAQTYNLIDSLSKKSIIQYRKFSSEYRVWQGSDFDLDKAVENERNRLGLFDLAETLNTRKTLPPVVARKHTINKGTLRCFYPTFANANSYKTIPQHSKNARIIFYLSECKSDEEIFYDIISKIFSSSDIVVLCSNSSQFREVASEVTSLNRVQVNSQELQSDRVAQRDFKDRLAAAELEEDKLLSSTMEDPGSYKWYWKNKQLNIKNKRFLQHEMSRILKSIYRSSPIIMNELINRDKLSSQATAARNKLIFAMHHYFDKEDLGIEKYPAEKSIYRALLKATGLHRKIHGKWQLCAPDKNNDPYHLCPVWEQIEKFFENSEAKPLSFSLLDNELNAPPYGIKNGLLPIFYVLAIHVYEHELAVYENGVYTPYFSEEQIERFTKKPEMFTVQRFRIQGMRASLFKQYSKVLYGKPKKGSTLLSVARPLAKFISDLPEYTKKTKRISQKAQMVRTAFALSKSPEMLLLDELPKACGFGEIDAKKIDGGSLESFSEVFTEILRELKHVFPSLLNEQQKLLCQAFNLDKKIELNKLREILRGRCFDLDQFTVDTEGLKAFLKRIVSELDSDEKWFKKLLLFLSRKPVEKWTDADRDLTEFQLSEFSRRINDLEKLRTFYGSNKTKSNGDFDVILLRTIRQGKGEKDEVVCIDKRCNELIKERKKEVMKELNQLPDDKLKLALIAQVADEVLSGSKESVKPKRKTNYKNQTLNEEKIIGKH